jgi:N-glycosidase YbiA
MAIRFYSKSEEYSWLSNFSAHSLSIDGVAWPSVEHYYQAQKYVDPAVIKRIREAPSALAARKAGQNRSLQVRPDWETIKPEVMRRAIGAKFTQHPSLRRRLLDTGEETLIHESLTDGFWGSGPDDQGLNMLGIIIMEVRAGLAPRSGHRVS